MRSSPLLHVTRELDHALEALVALADAGCGLTCDELAARTGLRAGFLSNVLQKLRRGGLLRRRPQRRSGYELAVPADQVCVAHVVAAVQGLWAGAPGGAGDQDDVDRLGPLWRDLERDVESRLQQVTLADLAAGVALRSA